MLWLNEAMHLLSPPPSQAAVERVKETAGAAKEAVIEVGAFSSDAQITAAVACLFCPKRSSCRSYLRSA